MTPNPKILGFVPARMVASRFPDKPLHDISGRPLLEHCYRRAKLYGRWDGLYICTCDEKIRAWENFVTNRVPLKFMERISTGVL